VRRRGEDEVCLVGYVEEVEGGGVAGGVVAGVGWMMGDGEGEGNKGEGGETHFGSCGGGLLGLAWVGDDLVSCGRTCRCNIYVSRGGGDQNGAPGEAVWTSSIMTRRFERQRMCPLLFLEELTTEACG